MFVKVFQKILDSSIARDYYARHVFEDMLKLADRDGVVDMTLDAIARRTNAPSLEFLAGNVHKLEQPDTESATETDDGRRIELLDDHRSWGWRIINYEKYRKIKNSEQVRAENRERKRKQRSRSVTNDVTKSHDKQRQIKRQRQI